MWRSHKADSTPHMDVLLHKNSASGINKKQTRDYTCKSYKDLSEKIYIISKLHIISQNVYHPSGLFPRQINKSAFILPCVFSATLYVNQYTTFKEKCSIWYIPTTLFSMLSSAQSIAFDGILKNIIKLMQSVLIQTLMVVCCLGWGEERRKTEDMQGAGIQTGSRLKCKLTRKTPLRERT